MKNVLLASTALVLTAGIASADMAVTGAAKMGLKYDGTNTTVISEIDFNIVGSGETDGGLAFGASVDLDADSDGTDTDYTGTADNKTVTGTVADPEVFISYNGLKLSIGDIDNAADQGGLSDVGFDELNVDNQAEIRAFGDHDVRVDYAFGDIAVAASVDSASDDWGVGVSASFDAFTVAVGFADTNNVNQTLVTLGYSAGAFGAKIFYNENGATDGMGLEGTYTTGDVTVTAVYAESGANEGYGIGVAYDLGGATLAGGVAEVNNTTVADLGISFAF